MVQEIDNLNDLTLEERIFCRILIDRRRNDERLGIKWHLILPNPHDDILPLHIAWHMKRALQMVLLRNDRNSEEWATQTPNSFQEDGQESETGTTMVAADKPEDRVTCRKAILTMFRKKQKRMSAGEVELHFQDGSENFCKTTLQANLSKLKTEGMINNTSDTYGKGYGLVEWSAEDE